MAAWIEMSLGMEVGLGPGDFVLDGYPAPPPQKGGRAPKFSAHVYCSQTAGWMKLKNILQGRPFPPEILAQSDLPTREGCEF